MSKITAVGNIRRHVIRATHETTGIQEDMEVCYAIAVNLVALAAKSEIQPLSLKWLAIIGVGLVLAVIAAALLGDDDSPPGPIDNPWDFT